MTLPGNTHATADVVVIGAGMAGLTAARELNRRGRTPLVLEAGDHVGGRIETVPTAYGYLENGGIFHTEHYPILREILAEVGLADRVVSVPTAFRSRILTDNGWRAVDYGGLTGPFTFRGTGLRDKAVLARAAVGVLARKPSRDSWADLTFMARYDDQSVAERLTDRATRFFTAGPHEFLWGVESHHLSFGMLALQLHVFRGELREVKGGIGQVPRAMAEGLEVRLDTAVTGVEHHGDGVRVRLADDSTVVASHAVIATSADVARAIWPDAPTPVREHLDAVAYSRIDYAYLHTERRVDLHHRGQPLSMEVVPSSSQHGTVLGGIYQANGWVTEGGLLLVTAGNAAGAASLTDDELLRRLRAEAEDLHPELRGQVRESRLFRHERYTPTFGRGSIRRLVAAREALPSGHVTLAGDHMAAPWVEGAARSGQLAARDVLAS